MSDINKPMSIPELNLKPPIDGKIRLSEDMQQVLSLLSAYNKGKRVLLKASESGVFNVTSARIKDTVHFTGVGANDTQTGDNVSCSEVLVMAHPDNTGIVWIRPDKTATVDNAWPLAAWDVKKFSIDNLSELNMLFVTDGDKAIVSYTI